MTALGCRQQHRHGHTGTFGPLAVGTAGQNDRHPRTEHRRSPLRRRWREKPVAWQGYCRLPCQAPAEYRHRFATLESIFLILAAILLIALSMASGSSSSPPRICPRFAILLVTTQRHQWSKASLGIDGFNSRQNRHLGVSTPSTDGGRHGVLRYALVFPGWAQCSRQHR